MMETYYNLTMMNNIDGKGRDTLERIARRVMVERGFQTDFSMEALNQVAQMQEVLGVSLEGSVG